MWRFHISSRPEIQFFFLKREQTHKQTELLNVIHHIVERSCISRSENVRTKTCTLVPQPLLVPKRSGMRSVVQFPADSPLSLRSTTDQSLGRLC